MDFKCKPLVAIVIIALAALCGCQDNEIEIAEDADAYLIQYSFEYENLTDSDIELSQCYFGTEQGPTTFSDLDIDPADSDILPANSSGSRMIIWPFRSYNFIPGDASFALRLASGEQIRILAGWTEAQYDEMPNVIVYGAGYSISVDQKEYFEFQQDGGLWRVDITGLSSVKILSSLVINPDMSLDFRIDSENIQGHGENGWSVLPVVSVE